MMKHKLKEREGLKFEAVKYKYIDDEDGEALLSFRVSMKHKLSAFAIPAKKRLELTVRVLD
ncbi:MAG TPA: hypothetical protein ENN27_01300 [Candidatus Atribacteria bacterium]|nr:hypothetical protein [Candidatus Atribacteria bacterium]